MKSKINENKNHLKMNFGRKYIAATLFLLAVFTSKAQIAIGKQTVEGNSTILDFNNVAGNNKGIILPALDTEPVFTVTTGVSSPNNGTFIYDRLAKKVKMFENNGWVELSTTGSDTQIVVNATNEASADQGAIIGASSSSAKGVLVLESSDKAMILPKIADPHTTVENPYPGMMCFDTVSKSLAVFDGTLWHYWK